MAYLFIATPVSDDRYVVRIDGAPDTLAAVQRTSSGCWKTELLSMHFGIESNAVDAFPDQPTAEAALQQLANWGHDELTISD
jgi:hypothetical protein